MTHLRFFLGNLFAFYLILIACLFTLIFKQTHNLDFCSFSDIDFRSLSGFYSAFLKCFSLDSGRDSIKNKDWKNVVFSEKNNFLENAFDLLSIFSKNRVCFNKPNRCINCKNLTRELLNGYFLGGSQKKVPKRENTHKFDSDKIKKLKCAANLYNL